MDYRFCLICTRIRNLLHGYHIIKGGDSMVTKSEKKRKNDNKTSNEKKANPITLDVKSDASEPVRGLPNL